MKISVIIDYENGCGFVDATTVKFDDQLSYAHPDWRGKEIGYRINEFLKSKESWERKSDYEQMILLKHDADKNYRGSAPAGDYRKTWSFEKLEDHGTICVPTSSKEVYR